MSDAYKVQFENGLHEGEQRQKAKDDAIIESLRSRLTDAEREARVLVVAMADKYGAPDNWKPLPDAAGMITQISNMVAGLREERAMLVQRAENAEAALADVTELYTQACEQRDDADALLRDIAEMRVPVLPSRFMDESMAEAARAHLARRP